MQTAKTTLHTLAVLALLVPSVAFPGYRTQVGYDQLLQEYGDSLPDGRNLAVMQIEAPNASGAWATSPTATEIAGKTVTYPYATVAPTAFSAHANTVALNLVGAKSSLIPGASTLVCSGASAYRATSLRMGQASPPPPATWDLENHSYAGNATTYNTIALQLFDLRIARDLTTVVVALENGTGALPPLFANAYNAITVGVSSGSHSRGGSNLDGSGRLKPDLVAPAGYTSYATPMVASAAGLLLAEAKRTAALAEAADPRVVKALLLTGATKDEFPTWAATSTRPLDPVYGAGELNVANAYKVLLAGRQTPAKTWRAPSGWDLAKSNTTSTYFFRVADGQTSRLTASLVWLREQTTEDYLSFSGEPADLALRLRRSDDAFARGAILAESNSPLDNVEHLVVPALPAGDYVLEVAGPAGVTYGLAWQGIATEVVTPVAPTSAALPSLATSTTTQASTAAPVPCLPSADVLAVETTAAGATEALEVHFTLTGREARRLLIRGLSGATLPGGLAQPVLSLSAAGSPRRLAYNDAWKAAGETRIARELTRLGLPALDAASHDAALFVSLAPGSYVLSLSEKRGRAGLARLLVADASPVATGGLRLTAIAARHAAAARLDTTLRSTAVPAPELIVAADTAGDEAPLLAVFSGGSLLAENTGWTEAASAYRLATTLASPAGAQPADDLAAVLVRPTAAPLSVHISPTPDSSGALELRFAAPAP